MVAGTKIDTLTFTVLIIAIATQKHIGYERITYFKG